MSSDGAAFGIKATDALDVILGDGDPAEKPTEGIDEMRAAVLATSRAGAEALMAGDDFDDGSYDYICRWIAHVVYEQFLFRPEYAQLPMDTEYDWTDYDGSMSPPVVQKGLDTVLRESGVYEREIAGLGITGFQWGWGVNAARRLVELPPQPNPAILDVG